MTKKENSEKGFALVSAIAVFLIFSMLSLLYISIVRSRVQTETQNILHTQAKYIAKSGIELAQLRCQGRTVASSNAGRNTSVVQVEHPDELPASGRILFAEHPLSHVYEYTKQGSGHGISLSKPLKQDVQKGLTIYLVARNFNSLKTNTLLNGTAKTQFIFDSGKAKGYKPVPSTAQIISLGELSGARYQLETAIYLP